MRIPFIKDNTKDKEKKAFHKAIQSEVWNITKKSMMRTLTQKDVDKLEGMYNKYFEKYPDEKARLNSVDRISKLRRII